MNHNISFCSLYEVARFKRNNKILLNVCCFPKSMFSTARDTSKIALAYLVHRLRAAGFVLCDTQFLTSHLASLGGVEIPRAAYRAKLAQAIALQAAFTAPKIPTPEALLADHAMKKAR